MRVCALPGMPMTPPPTPTPEISQMKDIPFPENSWLRGISLKRLDQMIKSICGAMQLFGCCTGPTPGRLRMSGRRAGGSYGPEPG